MAKNDKTVVGVSDLHCGQWAGLTPQGGKWRGAGLEVGKRQPLRKECWEFYKAKVKDIGKCHAAFVLADAVDGSGKASGGTELLVADMQEQCAMATEALLEIKTDRFVMVRGTPYHVGKDTDWEDLIARNLCKAGREATIHDHVWPEVNGCVFDLKHKVGGSSIPHGRGTSISKEKLWNSLWALHGGQQPDANVVLRGHVHYHICVSQAGWHAMTMPALQAAGTKYGGRQCSGTVDFGLMEFNINEKGAFRYEPHLLVPRNQTVKALKI